MRKNVKNIRNYAAKQQKCPKMDLKNGKMHDVDKNKLVIGFQ